MLWKKYDPNNPPTLNKEYFVTDGAKADVAGLHDYFDEIEWYPPERSNLDGTSITHYAEISLPPSDVELYQKVQNLSHGRLEVKFDIYEIVNLLCKEAIGINEAEKRLLQVYIQNGNLVIQLRKEADEEI